MRSTIVYPILIFLDLFTYQIRTWNKVFDLTFDIFQIFVIYSKTILFKKNNNSPLK